MMHFIRKLQMENASMVLNQAVQENGCIPSIYLVLIYDII